MSNCVHVLLLVEDDDNDIIITTRKLKKIMDDKSLLVVKSLQEAKEIINKNTIDLVLLDLNLPDSNGINTLTELKKFYSGIIIILTSIDDEAVGLQAMELGADDFINKSDLTEKNLYKSINYSLIRKSLHKNLKNIHENINKLEEKIIK